jgi:hypothetical protein
MIPDTYMSVDDGKPRTTVRFDDMCVEPSTSSAIRPMFPTRTEAARPEYSDRSTSGILSPGVKSKSKSENNIQRRVRWSNAPSPDRVTDRMPKGKRRREMTHQIDDGENRAAVFRARNHALEWAERIKEDCEPITRPLKTHHANMFGPVAIELQETREYADVCEHLEKAQVRLSSKQTEIEEILKEHNDMREFAEKADAMVAMLRTENDYLKAKLRAYTGAHDAMSPLK